jgi:outer membrane protein OmpA-like peptidoglycan-associated protein
MPTPQTAILRVTFADDDAVLNPQAQSEIEAFAKDFKERGGRVALKGYAGQPGDSSSNMRRLSLKRVLAVREQLLALGIAPERLDVRALGGVRDTGPRDRVDIVKSGR